MQIYQPPSDVSPRTHHCAYRARDGAPCQYRTLDRDLLEFNGHWWCQFHLPVQDSEGRSSPKANWDELTCRAFNQTILKLIANAAAQGQAVDLSGVVFPAAIAFVDTDAAASAPDISFAGADFCASANFATFTFSGTANFRDCVFRGETSFNATSFIGSADFEEAIFGADTWFRQTKFASNGNFVNADFRLDASFTATEFSGQAMFNGAQFHHYAGFDEVLFGGEGWFAQTKFRSFASFVNCKFRNDGNFPQAVFSGSAAFNNAEFNANALFAESIFGGDANFLQARFAGTARFESVTFHRACIFATAKFKRDTRFNQSIFKKLADFDRAKFFRDAGFADVVFEGALNSNRAVYHGHAGYSGADFSVANFDHAKFHSDALFSCPGNYVRRTFDENDLDDDERPMVSFRNAKFARRAVFSNRKFSCPITFQNAEFAQAPDFYGAQIRPASSFSGCQFLDRGVGNERAAWAYQSLKLLFEALGDRATTGMFFTLEQEALSNTHRSWNVLRILPTLYEITASNGESIAKPLLWLAGTTVLAFLAYLYLLHGLTPAELVDLPAPETLQLAKMALLPIITPFWTYADQCELCGRAIKIIMTLQSVLSLTWIVLCALAVRHRWQQRKHDSDRHSEQDP